MSMHPVGSRLRRFFAIAVAAVSVLGIAAPKALAAPDPDVNNAGMFELDGDVTREAPSTPPYDWSDLFTALGGRNTVNYLVNSTFTADPSTNDFAFITGSSKDNIDTSSWLCTPKPVTPKDEIQNSYAAAFLVPSNWTVAAVQKHVLVYMALERGTVSGTSNAGFWIFKNPIACDPLTGTFINPTTGARATHTDGDILLFASFTSGGTSATVQFFTWSTATGGLNAVATGADCAVSTTNLCGISNAFSPITTPWPPGSVGTNGFFEAGLDLTALLPTALQSTCFSTILADTRASASLTADLHDFNLGSFSLCATPTVKTTSNPATGVVGSNFNDTATVSGTIGNIAGETVTFNLYNNATCTGPAILTTTGSLSSGGVATTSTPFTPTATGTFYWVASYPGDRATGGLNESASSGCSDEPITVTKAPTSITTTPSSASIVVGNGNSFSDTANVSGGYFPAAGSSPDGTVTFKLYGPFSSAPTSTSCVDSGAGANLKAAYPDVSASKSPAPTQTSASYASPSFAPTLVGIYQWVATYNGNANSLGSSTNCGDSSEQVTVKPATPSVATTILLGDTVKVTGVPGAGVPTGTVTFTLFSNSACTGISFAAAQTVTLDGTGSASTTTSIAATPGGTYAWLVTFTPSGSNPNYTSAMTTCTSAQSDEQATISYAGSSPIH